MCDRNSHGLGTHLCWVFPLPSAHPQLLHLALLWPAPKHSLALGFQMGLAIGEQKQEVRVRKRRKGRERGQNTDPLASSLWHLQVGCVSQSKVTALSQGHLPFLSPFQA